MFTMNFGDILAHAFDEKTLVTMPSGTFVDFWGK